MSKRSERGTACRPARGAEPQAGRRCERGAASGPARGAEPCAGWRTDVVQCFPSKESLFRLVGAVLCEENVCWSGMHMFSEDSIASVDSFVAPEPGELEVAKACAKAREVIERAVEAARNKK